MTGLIKAIASDPSVLPRQWMAPPAAAPGITDLAKALCTLASLGYNVEFENGKCPDLTFPAVPLFR
ncbi:MAG: hypothetical protein R2875_04480 [Desulfobacterales bacterium]